MISGTALASHYLSPNTKIIGAEPSQKGDVFESFTTGQHKPNVIINKLE